MFVDRLNAFLFPRLIVVTRWATETERRDVVGRPLSRLLGAVTLALKRGRRQDTLERAVREWQRMMPSGDMAPITRAEPHLIHAELHLECPYRGTGNVAGCNRMMEYDRRLLEGIGADLVVLRSQAEPGVERCLVALSDDPAVLRELTPAHVRVAEA